MATIREILDQVDELRPNAFSEKLKMAWISELDGKIAADVMLMSIDDIRQIRYSYPENMDSEPLVGFPHDGIYLYWLQAQIDYANGEYNKYQNSMEMYNEHYSNFVRWFANTYKPAQGYPKRAWDVGYEDPPYYITAYSLAVKRGFEGTVDEWLESLKGVDVTAITIREV